MNNAPQQFDEKYIVANPALLEPTPPRQHSPSQAFHAQQPVLSPTTPQAPVAGGGGMPHRAVPPASKKTNVHWMRIIGALVLISLLAMAGFKLIGGGADSDKPNTSFKDVSSKSLDRRAGATGTGTAPRPESSKTVKPKTSSTQQGTSKQRRTKKRRVAVPAPTTGTARAANRQNASRPGARTESLPYTGAATWLILIIGGLLFAGGTWVRFNAMNVAVLASHYRRGPALRSENLKELPGAIVSRSFNVASRSLHRVSALIENLATAVDQRSGR